MRSRLKLREAEVEEAAAESEAEASKPESRDQKMRKFVSSTEYKSYIKQIKHAVKEIKKVASPPKKKRNDKAKLTALRSGPLQEKSQIATKSLTRIKRVLKQQHCDGRPSMTISS